MKCWFWCPFLLFIWASSWDYGTYRIGDQCAVSPEPLLFANIKYGSRQKSLTKNQTSSPVGWLCMRVWRMSLWGTKSAVISRVGSFGLQNIGDPYCSLVIHTVRWWSTLYIGLVKGSRMLCSNWVIWNRLNCHSCWQHSKQWVLLFLKLDCFSSRTRCEPERPKSQWYNTRGDQKFYPESSRDDAGRYPCLHFPSCLSGIIWTRSWENESWAICEQQIRRSVCASLQSDPHLCFTA